VSGDRGRIEMVDGKIKRVPSATMAIGDRVQEGVLQVRHGPSVRVTSEATVALADETSKPDPTQMSWRPLSQHRRVTFLGTSFPAVYRALGDVFGEFPLRLTRDHALTLRAMAAVAGEGREPYDQIAEALVRFSDIEVGVE
jgi:hypothetical protein